MHIAVAIVGFRNPNDIVRCLAALESSTHQDFEVIICENGGATAYAALCAVIPTGLAGGQAVRAVLAPVNLGYAGGVNLCLRETPLVDGWWVLNPDTEASPTAMAALVDRLSQGDCEMAGGTIHFPNGTVESRGGRWRPLLCRAVSIGYGSHVDSQVDPRTIETSVSYFSGASLMLNRAYLERVGPMVDSYFLYCEEVEWCLRGAARGMRLGYAPQALVLHYQGTTTGSGENVRQRSRMAVYLDERNKLLVTRDCFPNYLPVAALSALTLMILRFGRKGAWRQLAYGLDGWRAGLRNERGAPSWITL